MNTHMKLKIIGTTALASLGLIALVLSVQTFLSAGGASADIRPDATPDLEVLTTARSSADVLTTDLAAVSDDIGERGLIAERIRFLGESENAEYWAAVDRGGNICLVFQTARGLMGHACGSASQFNEEGVAVAIEGFDMQGKSEGYLSARLLPDRADIRPSETYSLEVPNVIALDPDLRDSGGMELIIPAKRGEALTIHVLGQVETESFK